MRVWTIGHSDRTLAELAALLQGYGVTSVADVRSVPRSRHVPWFDREALARSLPALGIAYRHFPGLGGWRHARKDSPNGGWRNASFRGYADYMQTPAFAEALGELLGAANAAPTSMMCAEAVPWRCHRSLIADALVVRGVEVTDILSLSSSRPHALTPFARVDGVDGTSITYPPGPEAR